MSLLFNGENIKKSRKYGNNYCRKKSGFANPFKNGNAACLCLIIKKGKEKYGFYSRLMQLSVIADKSTCMYNIQIAFSPIPLISTNKLTLIESSQK